MLTNSKTTIELKPANRNVTICNKNSNLNQQKDGAQ